MSNMRKIEWVFQEGIFSEFKEPLVLCFKLLEITPSTEKVSIENPWHAFLLNTLAKAQKSFWAILSLCERGFGEDAQILVRSLLEQAIAVKFIRLDTEKRLWDYIDYEVALKEKFLEEKQDSRKVLGSDFNAKALRQDIKEQKESISSEGRDPDRFRTTNNKVRNNWSGKGIETMAKKTQLIWHYDTVYWLACNLSHSTTLGLDHFVEVTDTTINFKPGPSMNLLPEVFTGAFEIYARILDVCLTDFEDDDGLKNFQAVVDKAPDIFKNLPQ